MSFYSVGKFRPPADLQNLVAHSRNRNVVSEGYVIAENVASEGYVVAEAD